VDLTKEGTTWIFISDSDENRHLYDIIFAVDVLRRRGVADERVLVFTDHPQAALQFAPYGIRHRALSEIGPTLATRRGGPAALLATTGHGRSDGIGAGRTVLTPHGLLSAVRRIPGLKRGVLVLGQCFAGIFDQVDAKADPELVLMGAARLNMSLSVPIKLAAPLRQRDQSEGLCTWSANLFLLKFFEWIATPLDVDGDGCLTLSDAYKHAGVQTNRDLVQIKSSLYLEVRDLASRVDLLGAKLKGPSPSDDDRLAHDAVTRQLQQRLEILHLHQEAWLLHAHLARDTRLAL